MTRATRTAAPKTTKAQPVKATPVKVKPRTAAPAPLNEKIAMLPEVKPRRAVRAPVVAEQKRRTVRKPANDPQSMLDHEYRLAVLDHQLKLAQLDHEFRIAKLNQEKEIRAMELQVTTKAARIAAPEVETVQAAPAPARSKNSDNHDLDLRFNPTRRMTLPDPDEEETLVVPAPRNSPLAQSFLDMTDEDDNKPLDPDELPVLEVKVPAWVPVNLRESYCRLYEKYEDEIVGNEAHIILDDDSGKLCVEDIPKAPHNTVTPIKAAARGNWSQHQRSVEDEEEELPPHRRALRD